MSLFEALPELNARAERLRRVLDCASEVLVEIDPAWTREKVKAVKPFVHKVPVKLGGAAKLTLDVLREAVVPMTARGIALEVMSRDEMVDASPADAQRVTNSVDATLRQKRGQIVDDDGGRPQRWRISLPVLIAAE